MAVVLAASTVGYINESTKSVVTSALPSSGRVIVIDAGHGYPDGGAVGESGVLEKDLNLSIAIKLQKLLEKGGAHVLLTRADDNAVVDNLKEKIREIKRKDLNTRRNFKNDTECDAFVSIHMNKFSDSRYSGAQVFYAKEPTESKLLSESIQSKLKEMVNPNNNRVAKTTDGTIFILKDSKVPSVIVECGFLSNSEEEALLKTDEYQDKIAFAIYSGILEYFSTQT